MRLFFSATVSVMMTCVAFQGAATAQQGDGPPKAKKAIASKSKAEPGMKTCTYKFPDGERRVWSCRKEEPCCAWDAIKYVKCGSTVTNCL